MKRFGDAECDTLLPARQRKVTVYLAHLMNPHTRMTSNVHWGLTAGAQICCTNLPPVVYYAHRI
jgi:hypothetical protein